jgi:hypothetical protein
MNDFFRKFESLNGASFVGIRSYVNKFGEVANINLLTNVNTMTAKVNDLAKLKAFTEDQLVEMMVAKKTKILFSVFKVALSELIASGEKNVSSEPSQHTAQSQGQADAYIHLCPGVKLHKDTLNIFISGFLKNKKVLVKGVYPIVNSRDKTIAKDLISSHLKLRMNDYRQYNLGNAEELIVKGSSLQIVKV